MFFGYSSLFSLFENLTKIRISSNKSFIWKSAIKPQKKLDSEKMNEDFSEVKKNV
jgi:hypothetical protein